MSVAGIRTVVVMAIALLALSGHTALAEDSKHRLVQFAQPGTPEAVIQAALVAALDTDEARGFKAYVGLVHPSRLGRRRGSSRAGSIKVIEQLRRYSWKRFRKQAPDYVLAESNGGFALTRTDPAKITPETRMVRFFVAPINNKRRLNPTPIRLERSGDTWRITANSL